VEKSPSSVPPTATTVKALEKSLVMSIPRQQLAAKVQQDVGFASRFTERRHSAFKQTAEHTQSA